MRATRPSRRFSAPCSHLRAYISLLNATPPPRVCDALGGRHIRSDSRTPASLRGVISAKFGLEAGSFEHVSAFNPGVNPISAAEAAADESLIRADTGKGIHKGRGGFQQHPPPLHTHCSAAGGTFPPLERGRLCRFWSLIAKLINY